jgi:hypothetical protein
VSLSNKCKDGGVAPLHLMETYSGCVGIAPVIPTLDSVCSWHYLMFGLNWSELSP